MTFVIMTRFRWALVLYQGPTARSNELLLNVPNKNHTGFARDMSEDTKLIECPAGGSSKM